MMVKMMMVTMVMIMITTMKTVMECLFNIRAAETEASKRRGPQQPGVRTRRRPRSRMKSKGPWSEAALALSRLDRDHIAGYALTCMKSEYVMYECMNE